MANSTKNNLQTPISNSRKRRKIDAEVRPMTPFTIPPSPCMKQLGYGTGVNVYLYERYSPLRGCYKSPWAVKKINSKLAQNDVNEECKDRLVQEAKILKSLSHPNIIGYRSSTKSEDGAICLVMESGENCLNDIIEEQADSELGPLSPEKILKVAKSIASALEYLHHDVNLLHGDLKSANVLIKGDFDSVKLCDFGVTLKLDKSLVVDNKEEFYVGTECWSAPEVFDGTTISNKTDIFSYGLIIWEMMSLNVPHLDKLNEDSDSETTEEMERKREEDFQKSLGTRPTLPPDIQNDRYKKIVELFCICTEAEQSKRPSAKQILSLYFS